MSTERDIDIVVLGGGLVGASAASLLAQQGRQVVLLDRQQPATWQAKQQRDLRVFAISPGSARVLAACQVWETICAARVSAYQTMQVTTAAGGELSFHAHQHGLQQLGWIVENSLIQSQLWTQLQDQIEIIVPAEITRLTPGKRYTQLELNDGTRIRTRLLIAADGGRSQVRQQLGIATNNRDYQQRALVAELQTAIPNQGIAWQSFLDTGPLALLPLGDGCSSMVWSLPIEQAEQASAWAPERLGAELSLASNGRFGQIKVTTPVASFPLQLLLAEKIRESRVVLVGDAAHQVHPLAGQGVNLGFQDVAALAEQLQGLDLQDNEAVDEALSKWARWRISENVLMTRGIDGIQRLFAKQSGIGGMGLNLVQGMWPLKDRFMQYACGIQSNAAKICRQ